ncbi:hypothetical protein GKR48_10815 [Providencia sp. wls1943]|uniref:Lipopolysaccharide biosynthesis protein n=1 Tax=Providencia alcalifaciens TaxID=126385 RepID=A0A346CLK8_9GAMM|nr:lipopolysaccharide biosynthesis protein [Providencia alcalifaciens]MTB67310.1 hypothetical protein [Providencia sp. wls1943]
MILLFFLLSILMLIEASTSLSRLAGYLLKTPESGLILQSSLALFSRMLMFLFMPFLGYLSDQNNLLGNESLVLLSSLFIPFGLILLYTFKLRVINIYSVLISRVNKHGSFFKGDSIFERVIKEQSLKKKKIGSLRGFYFLVLFSYIPYYLAWPIVILLLDSFHEQRGMILGMSSFFNGINTIVLTMFVDPKLIKIGSYKKILPPIYLNLIKIRIFSSIISIILLIIIYLLTQYL